MIRVEAGSSIPYLGFHWELSSSLKSMISEAGLYNIIPNIPFYCKSVVVPKSARVGRSVDYQLTITSRLFTLLQKCALFQYFAFSMDGCLLRKESLHTQTFSKLLTVQSSDTLSGR
jgi:hypothetical protein